MENAIQLTNVSKAFGKFKAVDNLSLSVPRGAMFGLLGPNGAEIGRASCRERV